MIITTKCLFRNALKPPCQNKAVLSCPFSRGIKSRESLRTTGIHLSPVCRAAKARLLAFTQYGVSSTAVFHDFTEAFTVPVCLRRVSNSQQGEVKVVAAACSSSTDLKGRTVCRLTGRSTARGSLTFLPAYKSKQICTHWVMAGGLGHQQKSWRNESNTHTHCLVWV